MTTNANETKRGNEMNELHTVYFTKHFTSGYLKGISVPCKITTNFPNSFRIGTTGKDYGTKAKWIITDASFQNYFRH